MKTKTICLLTFSIFLFAAHITNAQFVEWHTTGNTLTGGTPATPNEYIGSNNNYDWIIKTNNTERMRIQSGGNVGIGTTTPASGLHIKGAYPLGYLTVERTGVNAGGHAAVMTLNTDAKTAADGSVFGFGALNSSSAATQYAQIRMIINSPTASSESGELGFYTINSGTNAEKIRIKNNGNVGIGTSSPSEKLTVSTSTSTYGLIHTDGTTTVGTWVDATAGWLGTKSNHNLNLFTNNGSARLTVTTAGDVGIGTTSPGTKLEVNGQVKITGGSPGAGKVLTSDANGLATWNSAAPTGWSITGNSGTVDGTNFIGTTDNIPFNIRMNNIPSGRIDGSNTYLGFSAAYHSGTSNTGYSNTGIGGYALEFNTTGSENVACGLYSLEKNTTGGQNTALGNLSLEYNTTGSFNTANGKFALYLNTTGGYNTGIGLLTLAGNTTGSNNTALGYAADVSSSALSNTTAIGNSATATANNFIRIGNSTVATIQGQVAFSTSDGRFKTNIQETVKGLEFINKLRPVTYQMNTNMIDDYMIQNMPDSIKILHKIGMDFAGSSAITHAGFIAQEVEDAAQQVGFVSSIVHHPENTTDPYALAYAEIVVPLVKAVQELSKTTDSLKTKISSLESMDTALANRDLINTTAIYAMQTKINQLDSIINSCCNMNSSRSMSENNSNNISSFDVNLKDGQSIVLDQNVPNPFAEQTTINYYLPENTSKAQMLFYNASGNLIQSVDLKQKGQGQLNVFANDLTNGIYTYTLVVDGKVFDTKKMVKQ